jgi:putative DNA primase/helicase
MIEHSNEQYKKEMDIIQVFLDDNVDYIQDATCGANELYETYNNWAKKNNEWHTSSTIFGRELKKRFDSKRSSTGMKYIGIRLKKDNPDPAYVYEK